MRRVSRACVAFAIAFAATLPHRPTALLAQGPLVLQGTLVRISGNDTLPIIGTWVVAHKIGEAAQGPIDSQRTDAFGRFRFTIPTPDSGFVYIVSSRHDGIGYFSEPVVRGAKPEPLNLAVFDTSSSGPPLTLGSRNIVITRSPAGGHKVLDIYQIFNGGNTTRTAADTLAPTWSAMLPKGVALPQAGQSEVPPAAIHFENGRVSVAAPFPPGTKQVVVTYELPAGKRTLDVDVDQPTAGLELLIEDSTAQVTGALGPAEPLSIEGHVLRRFTLDSAAAGAAFSVHFGATGGKRDLGLIVALVTAVALGGGAVISVWRRGAVRGTPSAEAPDDLAHESRERLVAQLAALDERFEGKEQSTPPEQWSAYQSRRSALKAALARSLAQG